MRSKVKKTTNPYKLGHANYFQHKPAFIIDGVGYCIERKVIKDLRHKNHIDLFCALKELECRGCNTELKAHTIQYSARRGYFGYCQSCTDDFIEEAKERAGCCV